MSFAEKIRRRCSVFAIPSELLVERAGRPVAVLSEPLLEDMFWFRWKITPLIADERVMSGEFWGDAELLSTVVRSKESGVVANGAFWSGVDPVRDGRLVLRGAIVPCEVSFRRQPITWLRLFAFGGGAYGRRTRDDWD